MAEICLKFVIGIVLLSCGLQDMLKKKVYLWLLIAGGIVTIICLPFCDNISLVGRIVGAAVGVFVILLSLMTGGKIGIADGILLCITGLGLGFWGNVELFCLALLLAAGLSMALLVMRKVSRRTSLPFIPFMFAGYIIITLAGLS
jgi:leader peptidase (prepilin peptidase)/N-methyltransferase